MIIIIAAFLSVIGLSFWILFEKIFDFLAGGDWWRDGKRAVISPESLVFGRIFVGLIPFSMSLIIFFSFFRNMLGE